MFYDEKISICCCFLIPLRTEDHDPGSIAKSVLPFVASSGVVFTTADMRILIGIRSHIAAANGQVLFTINLQLEYRVAATRNSVCFPTQIQLKAADSIIHSFRLFVNTTF